jgi:hypothetical protein
MSPLLKSLIFEPDEALRNWSCGSSWGRRDGVRSSGRTRGTWINIQSRTRNTTGGAVAGPDRKPVDETEDE